MYCPHCHHGKGTTTLGDKMLLRLGATIICDFCGKKIKLKNEYILKEEGD